MNAMESWTSPGARRALLLSLLYVLTVCTTLRLPGLPVGIGELGLALVGAASLVLMRDRLFPSLRQYRVLVGFWGLYLVVLAVAGGFSLAAGRLSVGWLHDVMALGFAIGTAFVWLLLAGDSREQVTRFALGFAAVACLVSGLAFLLIVVDYHLGGPVLSTALKANSWWSGRFSAWAADPNQWALLLLVAGMLLVLAPGRPRLLWLAVLLWLFMEVRSDAAVMGMTAFMVLYAGITFLRQPARRREAGAVLLVFLAVSGTFRLVADKFPPSPVLRVIGAVTGAEPTEKMLSKRKRMQAEGNPVFVGGGTRKLEQRMTLWSNSVEAWSFSPVIGLGPGAYSGHTGPLQNTESHNLYLQVLVNTGLAGILAALGLVAWLARALWRSPEAAPWIAALAGLLVQGMGQYLARHPVFWLLIAVVAWQAVQAHRDAAGARVPEGA